MKLLNLWLHRRRLRNWPVQLTNGRQVKPGEFDMVDGYLVESTKCKDGSEVTIYGGTAASGAAGSSASGGGGGRGGGGGGSSYRGCGGQGGSYNRAALRLIESVGCEIRQQS